MTLIRFEYVVELVQEEPNINTIWRYQRGERTMYAAFLRDQYCDILGNEFVENPILIFDEGKFIEKELTTDEKEMLKNAENI